MSFGKRPKADYLLLKLDQINIVLKYKGVLVCWMLLLHTVMQKVNG